MQDMASRLVQGQTGLHDFRFAADNAEVVVASAQGVGELEEVGQDGGRL